LLSLFSRCKKNKGSRPLCLLIALQKFEDNINTRKPAVDIDWTPPKVKSPNFQSPAEIYRRTPQGFDDFLTENVELADGWSAELIFNEVLPTLGDKTLSPGGFIDPSEYLSPAYIIKHSDAFKDGAVRFVPQQSFVEYKGYQKDGTAFVMTRLQAEELLLAIET